MFVFIRSFALLGVVLIQPSLVAFLPFFVPNPEWNEYDYSFNIISGQVWYFLEDLTKERGNDVPKAHVMNICIVLFPALLAVLVMIGNSLAVAAKLLKRSTTLSNENENNNKSNNNRISTTSAQRSSSITILILATVFLATYTPFCFLRIVDVSDSYEALAIGHRQLFYLAPSCYLVAYLSSAINPLVYHLRGKSIFDSWRLTDTEERGTIQHKKSTRSSITINWQATTISMLETLTDAWTRLEM